MATVSTLAGDSLGAAVWLLIRPTRVAAPMATPTAIEATTLAMDADKWTPLEETLHGSSRAWASSTLTRPGSPHQDGPVSLRRRPRLTRNAGSRRAVATKLP